MVRLDLLKEYSLVSNHSELLQIHPSFPKPPKFAHKISESISMKFPDIYFFSGGRKEKQKAIRRPKPNDYGIQNDPVILP